MRAWGVAFLIGAFPELAAGAAGDIIGVNIHYSGRMAEIHISGVGTNAPSFNFGLGTSNKLTGSEKFTLTLTTPGFDDSGVSNGFVRKIYGTKQMRLQYPSNSLADATVAGGNAIFRIALSDHVLTNDVNITADIGASMITAGGTPNNSSSALSVTNGSVRGFAYAIHDWSVPAWQVATNNSVEVRAVAFHRSADQGRPVRAMKFWAEGTNGTYTPTQTVTTCSAYAGWNDALPVAEYKGTLDVSGLPQGGWFTNKYEVVPWLCDRTFFSTNTLVFWNNRAGTFGSAWASVDPTNGVDAAAIAYTNSANPATVTKFLTLGAAMAAIRATNNIVYGHNGVSQGVVWLTNGTYPFLGASVTAHTPVTWVTIKPLDFVSRDDVMLTNSSTAPSWNGAKIKIERCWIVAGANSFINANSASFHWFDQVKFDSSFGGTGSPLATTGRAYFTANRIIKMGNQNFQPASGTDQPWPLIRGNNFSGFDRAIYLYTTIGNSRSNIVTQQAGYSPGPIGSTIPYRAGYIMAFNFIGCWSNNSTPILLDAYGTNMIGAALIQNVGEGVGTNNSFSLIEYGQGSSAVTTNVGVLEWHNTWTGGKETAQYNDAGAPVHEYASKLNNYGDMRATKTDNNITPFDGSRTNNWDILWGVGASGVINAHINGSPGIGAPGSFKVEFPGLSSYTGQDDANVHTWPKFVDRKSWTGNTSDGVAAGNGDYRLQSDSPLRGLAMRWVLPIDLAGNPRVTNGAIGAFEFVDNTPPARKRGILRKLF